MTGEHQEPGAHYYLIHGQTSLTSVVLDPRELSYEPFLDREAE